MKIRHKKHYLSRKVLSSNHSVIGYCAMGSCDPPQIRSVLKWNTYFINFLVL